VKDIPVSEEKKKTFTVEGADKTHRNLFYKDGQDEQDMMKDIGEELSPVRKADIRAEG